MFKIKQKGIIASFVFVILFTIFIFSNSLKGPGETNSDSGFILSLIKPIIDRIVEIDTQMLHIIIRKLAHFTEFCLLGLASSSLCIIVKTHSNKALTGVGLFYCLFVGVVDEFIQSFTGRTSSVKDVIIDFSGAVFGFIIVFIVNLIVKKIKKSKGA